MDLKELGKAINKEHFARRCELKRYRVQELFAGKGKPMSRYEWKEFERVFRLLKKEINETKPEIIEA